MRPHGLKALEQDDPRLRTTFFIKKLERFEMTKVDQKKKFIFHNCSSRQRTSGHRESNRQNFVFRTFSLCLNRSVRFAICNEIFENWSLNDAMTYAKAAGYDAIEIAPFTLAKNVNLIPASER